MSFAHAGVTAERPFEFTYELLPTAVPEDQPVEVFLPLPPSDGDQTIESERLQTDLEMEILEDPVYGNRYYRLFRAADSDVPVAAKLTWTVRRRESDGTGVVPLQASERAQFLNANSKVPVGHEVLDPIRAEIHAMRADESPAATARAIYDWVVDNVEYKKVGTGWGNGDTFWACNSRYGNCTDFHALFISLARTEGIPSKFEIGFPVPTDRPEGKIGGYHCWVEFFLPERGWVPIDASEAAKHPQQRELLFGNQPADRILFTTGRDIVVSEQGQPLNYFIYPHVAVGGVAWPEKLETRFSFRELSQGDDVAVR